MRTQADINALNLILGSRMEAERRAFARRLDAAVRRVARTEDTMTVFAYQQISRELEAIMTEWYGSFPGDQSARFDRLITEEANRRWQLAAQRQREDVLRRTARTPAAREVVRA